jgi:hypothetical protein
MSFRKDRPKPVALIAGGCMAVMAAAEWLGFGGLPGLLSLGAGLFTANYLVISGNLGDAGRLRMLITLVIGAMLLVVLLRKLRLALPRPIVVDVASAFLLGLGMSAEVTLEQ